MNEPDSNGIIFILVGAGIILFNIGIIYGLLTGSTQRQLKFFRRAFQNVRRPFASESEALDELHQRIERLNQPVEPDEADSDG
jgi:hypothetical protein